MYKEYVFIFLLILFSFTGCSSESGKTRIEVIDGVEFVHNHAEPLNPEKTVTFEEELSIGEENDSNEVVLYRPADILIHKKGDIYISDYQDGSVKVFDKDGNCLQIIGKKGQGPGEFQRVSSMAFLPDFSLLCFDVRMRRTSLFDGTGGFLKSHKWRSSHFDILFVDDLGYLTDTTVFGENTQLFINKFDFDGNEIENWGEFNPYRMKVKKVGEGVISIGVPYTPMSIFTADPARKRLYHCMNDQYLIEVYENSGQLIRKIDRPYKPVPFMQKDAEEYYANVDRRGEKVFSDLARDVELPKVKTITEYMIVDDRGYLWVATNETRDEKGVSSRAWDIFDLEGYYDCRVWLDFNPGFFAEGKMYRRHQYEDTGFMVVMRYGVKWSE